MAYYFPLENTIQEYPWGSLTSIPELTGQPQAGETPQAELWMGAHPRGASRLTVGGRATTLLKLTTENPREWRGFEPGQAPWDDPEESRKEQGGFPFLFKILAAAQPLSIQVHPSRAQARAGFVRENEEGIPLNAVNRSYKDRNHKPEVLCALTPFRGMCGFRHPLGIDHEMRDSGVAGIFEEAGLPLPRSAEEGLKAFFETLMDLPLHDTEATRRAAEKAAQHSPLCRRLQHFFPGDIGVLAGLYLNEVKLSPGEAVYLPAGVLHAYVEGTGIEVMANSDNVLRGGLTVKHIDRPELKRVLRFQPHSPQILGQSMGEEGGITGGPDQLTYDPGVADFSLQRCCPDVAPQGQIVLPRQTTPSILLALGKTGAEGPVLSWQGADEAGKLKAGDSLFIKPNSPSLTLRGPGVFYRATVPEVSAATEVSRK